MTGTSLCECTGLNVIGQHTFGFGLYLLGVTTMGAHHSVTSVTHAIIPWSWSRFSSAFNLSLHANRIDRGVLTQKGMAFSLNDI